jgi:hypothetical protein
MTERLRRESLQKHLDALANEYRAVADALVTELNPDSRTRLQGKLEALLNQMSDIETQISALGAAPAGTPAPSSAQPNTPSTASAASAVDRTALRNALGSRMNLSELKTLCFDLGLDYENLAGDTKTDKVVNLISYFENRQQLERLVKAVQALRSDIVL